MITGDTFGLAARDVHGASRVFFGYIKAACGEGISLVVASRVIILDIHLSHDKKSSWLLGPDKKKRILKRNTALHVFKKEHIAKRWLEWSKYNENQDFELEDVDPKASVDEFLESDMLANDIQSLYTR